MFHSNQFLSLFTFRGSWRLNLEYFNILHTTNQTRMQFTCTYTVYSIHIPFGSLLLYFSILPVTVIRNALKFLPWLPSFTRTKFNFMQIYRGNNNLTSNKFIENGVMLGERMQFSNELNDFPLPHYWYKRWAKGAIPIL